MFIAIEVLPPHHHHPTQQRVRNVRGFRRHLVTDSEEEEGEDEEEKCNQKCEDEHEASLTKWSENEESTNAEYDHYQEVFDKCENDCYDLFHT